MVLRVGHDLANVALPLTAITEVANDPPQLAKRIQRFSQGMVQSVKMIQTYSLALLAPPRPGDRETDTSTLDQAWSRISQHVELSLPISTTLRVESQPPDVRFVTAVSTDYSLYWIVMCCADSIGGECDLTLDFDLAGDSVRIVCRAARRSSDLVQQHDHVDWRNECASVLDEWTQAVRGTSRISLGLDLAEVDITAPVQSGVTEMRSPRR